MFLAHILAGCMVSKTLLAQFHVHYSKTKLLLALGVLGSVCPDLDILYFYLMDHRHHSHQILDTNSFLYDDFDVLNKKHIGAIYSTVWIECREPVAEDQFLFH